MGQQTEQYGDPAARRLTTPTWVIALGGVVTLAILLSSFVSVWNAAAEEDVKARLKALRAAGEPVTIADLEQLHPRPPDDEDGTEFLEQAFDLMREGGDRSGPWDSLRRLMGPARRTPPSEALPVELVQAMHECLAKHGALFPLLEKAIGRGRCWFPIDLNAAYHGDVPRHNLMDNAVSLFALRAIERAEGGDTAGAADALCKGLRFADMLEDEPIGISWRMYYQGCMAQVAERWICRCNPPLDELYKVQACLLAQSWEGALARGCVARRCVDIHEYQNCSNFGAYWGGGLAHRFGVRWLESLGAVLPRGTRDRELCQYLDIMDEFLAALRLPYPQSLVGGRLVGADLRERLPVSSLSWPMLKNGLDYAVEYAQERIAVQQCAGAAIGVERFRLRYGQLPNALAEIAPEFIDAVPVDPFDGEPLRYKATEDGFVVYSVNSNKIDDGGVRTDDYRQRYALDTVFRVARPPPGACQGSREQVTGRRHDRE